MPICDKCATAYAGHCCCLCGPEKRQVSMKTKVLDQLDKHGRSYVERLEVLKRLVNEGVKRGEISSSPIMKALGALEKFDEYA